MSRMKFKYGSSGTISHNDFMKLKKAKKVIWTAEEIAHKCNIDCDDYPTEYDVFKDKQFLDADEVKKVIKECIGKVSEEDREWFDFKKMLYNGLLKRLKLK